MEAAVLFGLSIPPSGAPGSDPVAAAVDAERLGFDFVSSSDHPQGTNPSNEVWTMLCFVAAATSRIHIATRVLGLPYRAPAMVAKMAETLDRLSGDRLILGLGGGFGDDEHRAFGLDVRSPKDKTEALEEALKIIRGLWTEPRFSFDGRFYRTDVADLEPKPQHRIPIWLGTFAPRSLALTGRLADGWIPSLGYRPTDELPAMRERVLAGARDAGRDPGEITCALNVTVRIGETADDPSIIAGTPEQIAERLVEFARVGFSAFNFMLDPARAREDAELLAREVIPDLRTIVE
jgi:alkanesulfonate monooxygenase SsuD/methylene tetrahydromethanopterin reductase-like flavin-dependent oxidoreductase (luciferase family)